MIKNGFLTLMFSFFPGAGQMYQGYMKRGLSHVSLFFLFAILGGFFGILRPIIFLSAIVYMYSFFDSLNLRSQLKAGETPADEYAVDLSVLSKLNVNQHKLIGWGLIAFGAYSIFDLFVCNFLYYFARLLGSHSQILYDIFRYIPNVVVAALFIYAGFRLVRNSTNFNHNQLPQEIDDDFTEFKGE